MTTTMQAVHVTQLGEPEMLQPVTIERPTPKMGEALVKLTYSSVNFNDFMERADYFHREGDPVREVPFILGSEGIGAVEAVGTDLTQVKVEIGLVSTCMALNPMPSTQHSQLNDSFLFLKTY